MANEREIIFKSEHLTVVCSDYGTRTVIATFNGLAERARGTYFWGDHVLERVGASAVGFVSARPNWFPPADMAAAIEAVRARTLGRRIVTYGNSQGGYAALKFGGALGADLAVAFCPQWSINPADVAGFDRRFMRHYRPQLRNGERIEQQDLCPNNIVVYDPAEYSDRLNAEKIVSLGRTAAVLSPFSLHGAISLISEGGTGRALVSLLMREAPAAPAELRALIRQGRARSRTYNMTRVERLAGLLPRHRTFFERALATCPEGVDKSLYQALLACVDGAGAQAEVLLSALDDDALLDSALPRHLARFRRLRFAEGIQRLAPLVPRALPEHLSMRLQGVAALADIDAVNPALAELKILAERPDAVSEGQTFVHLYIRLNRPDLALRFFDLLLSNGGGATAEHLRVGFQLVDLFRAKRMRPELFRLLLKLAALCVDDFARTRKIADLMISIDEIFGAAKIMEAARATSPAEERLRAAYQVFGRSGKTTADEIGRVEQLLAEPEGEFDYWFMLGGRVEPFVGHGRAAEASRRAVAVASGPEERLRAKAQLLGHLGWLGDVAAMRRVVREIPLDEIVGARKAFQFAVLADRAGDHRRAVEICHAWQCAEPESPQPALLLSRLHADAEEKHEAEAAMNATLEAIAGQPRQARRFYSETIKLAGPLGYPLEKRAVDLALAAFPDDPEFRALAARDEFASKFFSPDDPPPPQRKGILARLGLARGR
jgi:hypothetical protein